MVGDGRVVLAWRAWRGMMAVEGALGWALEVLGCVTVYRLLNCFICRGLASGVRSEELCWRVNWSGPGRVLSWDRGEEE